MDELSDRMNRIYDYLEDINVYPLILPCSSQKNLGISEIRGSILQSSGLLEARTLMEKEKGEKEKEKIYNETKETLENSQQNINSKQLKKLKKIEKYQKIQSEKIMKEMNVKDAKIQEKKSFIFGLEDDEEKDVGMKQKK